MDNRIVVHKAIDLPDGSGKLIVLDWSSDGPKRRHNLVRVDTEGDEVWRAALPQSSPPDFFTDVRFDGNTVWANTRSCWSVTLDLGTGKILSAVFTK